MRWFFKLPLGLRDLKTVSLHSTLAELGMDSMMGVEIKQTLEREFEVFLTPQDIRSLTFAKLYEISAASDGETKTDKNGTYLDFIFNFSNEGCQIQIVYVNYLFLSCPKRI